MVNPGSSDSPQVKLMYELDSGFVKRDLDIIAKQLHKDYRHITHPRSLGMPEQTREEWLKHFAWVMSLWTENESTVHSITEAPGKVVVHVTSKIKTSIGVDKNHESIYIAQIATDEDGGLKIKQIEEFTDSKAHLDFAQAVMAAQACKSQE